AFLGYNPVKQLLGPLLAHLPAAHAAYVTGRQFFPHLITNPFHDGLGVAFAFAIAANVLAAVASLLTGPRPPAEVVLSGGAGLAPVAEEAAEIALPDLAADGANGETARANGQSAPVTE